MIDFVIVSFDLMLCVLDTWGAELSSGGELVSMVGEALGQTRET